MLLRLTEDGLYCEAGGFHVDPWRPVERAVITHAHGDHARWGSGAYLCSREGEGVTRTRLGPEARIRAGSIHGPAAPMGIRRPPSPVRHGDERPSFTISDELQLAQNTLIP